MGAFVSHTCHATTACLQLFKEDPQVIEYLADLENMTKIVIDASIQYVFSLISNIVDLITGDTPGYCC